MWTNIFTDCLKKYESFLCSQSSCHIGRRLLFRCDIDEFFTELITKSDAHALN